MEYESLGSTGLQVSRISCGALYVSSYGGTDFEIGMNTVKRALDLGMNYIDTAPAYNNSEEFLGKFLPEVSKPYYLSTKLGGRPTPFNPMDKKQMVFSIEESLRLLKRDHVDILYIHEPDRPGQYNWFESWDELAGPVLEVLEDLKKRGLIRFTGLGGTTVYEMTRLVEKGNFDVLLTAFNYSLLFREAEQTLIPSAKKKGMGVVAASPLQQGWFTNRREALFFQDPPPWLSPLRAKQIRKLYDLLDETGLSLPELALRFVLSNKDIDTVLTGGSNSIEVEANVASCEKGPLPADILTAIDEIAAMLPCRPCEEPFKIRTGKSYKGSGAMR